MEWFQTTSGTTNPVDNLPINTMDFILGSSHTLSHVQNNKWPYGPARLGRLPVTEEIAGSNPVGRATDTQLTGCFYFAGFHTCIFVYFVL